MLKQIGKSLQQTRTARGLTQAELGTLVGLPQSHISKIERGETDFQWTTLEQIANAVGLSPILVPTGLVPLVESLMNGRERKRVRSSIRNAIPKDLGPEEVVLSLKRFHGRDQTTSRTRLSMNF